MDIGKEAKTVGQCSWSSTVDLLNQVEGHRPEKKNIFSIYNQEKEKEEEK
jgi:hypothetical protein